MQPNAFQRGRRPTLPLKGQLAYAAGIIAPLLLAGLLTFAPISPAASQKVALPNGEVVHFGTHSGHTNKAKPIWISKTSLEIAEREKGISSIVWHIVAGRHFKWDESNDKYSRNAVVRWLNSDIGEKYVLARMTDTRDPFGVFPNGLVNLDNEFGSDKLQGLNQYINQRSRSP